MARKDNSGYATGIVLVLVGVFGAIGSITGTLPSMLAALWVPEILTTSTGSSAVASNPLNSAANAINLLNPVTGPVQAVGDAAQQSFIDPIIGKIKSWL